MRTGAFETDTKRAEKALQDFKKKAVDVTKNVALQFTAVGTAVAYFAKQTIDGIDALNDVADATGASIENISALENVALRTGGTLENVSSILVKFNNVLKEGDPDKGPGAVIKALGLSLEELKQLDPAEALRRTSVALAQFADDGAKARAVQELFGKSVAEVAPLLKDLAEQTKLVGTVTKEQAEEAEKFNKAIFNLKTDIIDLSRGMLGDLLPAINEIIDAFKRGQKEGQGFFEKGWAGYKNYVREFWGIEQQKGRMATGKVQEFAGGGRGFVNPDLVKPSINIPSPAPTTKVRPIKIPPIDVNREFYKDVPMAADEQARFDAIAKRKNMLEGEKKAIEEYNRVLQDGADIYEATRTPLEKLNAEEARLTELLQQGAIDWDTYSRAVMQANEAYTASTEKLKETTNEMDQFAKKAAENIQDQLGSGLYDIMQGNFKNIGNSFKQMLDRMVAEALAAKLARSMFGGLVEGGSGEGWFGKALSFAGSFFGGAKAGGGDVIASRPYLVGENGPEMFVPRTAGSILPNQDTAPAQRQGSTIVVNMQANPQMSRDAALQQGQRVAQGLQLAMLRNG